MVNNSEQQPRCGSCQEVTGNVWQGYVYCHYLKCDVWAQSLMCQHGIDLDDAF